MATTSFWQSNATASSSWPKYPQGEARNAPWGQNAPAPAGSGARPQTVPRGPPRAGVAGCPAGCAALDRRAKTAVQTPAAGPCQGRAAPGKPEIQQHRQQEQRQKQDHARLSHGRPPGERPGPAQAPSGDGRQIAQRAARGKGNRPRPFLAAARIIGRHRQHRIGPPVLAVAVRRAQLPHAIP